MAMESASHASAKACTSRVPAVTSLSACWMRLSNVASASGAASIRPELTLCNAPRKSEQPSRLIWMLSACAESSIWDLAFVDFTSSKSWRQPSTCVIQLRCRARQSSSKRATVLSSRLSSAALSWRMFTSLSSPRPSSSSGCTSSARKCPATAACSSCNCCRLSAASATHCAAARLGLPRSASACCKATRRNCRTSSHRSSAPARLDACWHTIASSSKQSSLPAVAPAVAT
mmetsp:Transcript_2892/g.8993  ORF Transcript_2892/g.8993 Transcript_2892/m.8993 type:complete len:231 (+) Transcript_2892:547-1239(+)